MNSRNDRFIWISWVLCSRKYTSCREYERVSSRFLNHHVRGGNFYVFNDICSKFISRDERDMRVHNFS
jgi:hypothetical protein